MTQSRLWLLSPLALWALACGRPAASHDAGLSDPPREGFVGTGLHASPACLVSDNGGAFVAASPYGVNVSPGDSVTVKLLSTSGVRYWNVAVFGTDDSTLAAGWPALTFAAGPPNTYSFTFPGSAGRAVILQSVVNGGVDVNGVSQPSYSTTIGVWSLFNGQRVLATSETYESNPAGWVADINPGIRSTQVGLYGEAYAVAGDALSFTLPTTSSVATVPFAHVSAAALNTKLVDGGGVEPTISGPVVVEGLVSYTTPTALSDGGNAQINFQLYQNSTPLPDSLVPRKGSTGSLTSLELRSLQIAQAFDVFTLRFQTANVSSVVSFPISNASLTVTNAGANQGPAGAVGPPGSGSVVAISTLTASLNSIPAGPTANAVDTTANDVQCVLPSIGATNGEVHTFTIIAGTNNLVVSSALANIVNPQYDGTHTATFTQGGVGSSVSFAWDQADSLWVPQ